MVSFTNNLDHSLANCFSLVGSEHVHSDLLVVFKGEYLESKQSIDFWILAAQQLAPHVIFILANLLFPFEYNKK